VVEVEVRVGTNVGVEVGVTLELGWSWVGVMLRLVDVRLELC